MARQYKRNSKGIKKILGEGKIRNTGRNKQMVSMKPENMMLINSAITHFIGEPIADLSRFDKSIVFQTAKGNTGFMEPNFSGNWDIWIGEEIVYEIENELFEVIEFDRNSSGGLIEFYNYLKNVNHDGLKFKSKAFFDIIKNSVENIILNHSLPIEGDTKIGIFEIHYKKNNKIKISLN